MSFLASLVLINHTNFTISIHSPFSISVISHYINNNFIFKIFLTLPLFLLPSFITTLDSSDSPPSLPSPPSISLLHNIITHSVYIYDYICPILYMEELIASSLATLASGTAYPLSTFLSYSHFSPSYITYLTGLTFCTDPSCYFDGICHSHWYEAISAEISNLKNNSTWTLKPQPLVRISLDVKRFSKPN